MLQVDDAKPGTARSARPGSSWIPVGCVAVRTLWCARVSASTADTHADARATVWIRETARTGLDHTSEAGAPLGVRRSELSRRRWFRRSSCGTPSYRNLAEAESSTPTFAPGTMDREVRNPAPHGPSQR